MFGNPSGAQDRPGYDKTGGQDLAARQSANDAFAANAEPASQRTPMINWTAASFGIGSMANAPAEAALARSSRTHADPKPHNWHLAPRAPRWHETLVHLPVVCRCWKDTNPAFRRFQYISRARLGLCQQRHSALVTAEVDTGPRRTRPIFYIALQQRGNGCRLPGSDLQCDQSGGHDQARP